jgi:hypothetical protein
LSTYQLSPTLDFVCPQTKVKSKYWQDKLGSQDQAYDESKLKTFFFGMSKAFANHEQPSKYTKK